MRNRQRFQTLLFLSTLLFLGACTTPRESDLAANGAASPSHQGPSNLIHQSNLEKGMTADILVATLGKPDEVNSTERQGSEFEVWEYSRRFSQFKGTQATGVERIPYIDPLTGEEKEQLVPVMQNATANLMQITELLLHEGVLLEWKQRFYELGTSYQ